MNRFRLPLLVGAGALALALATDAQGVFDPATQTIVGASPMRVSTGDLDGDRLQDLVVANLTDGTLSVLLASSPESLEQQMAYPVGSRAVDVATADFDGDGNLDVVSLDDTAAEVQVLLGDGLGMLGTGRVFAAVSGGVTNPPTRVAVGDLNSDGLPDLVVLVPGPFGQPSHLFLLENQGGSKNAWAGFAAPTDLPIVVSFGFISGLADIAIGDVTGDGIDDIVAPREGTFFLSPGSNVYTFPGDGQGSILPAVQTFVGSSAGPDSVSLADVDGDGDLDLATANAFSGNVSVLRNAGVDSSGAWNGFGLYLVQPPFAYEFGAANASDVAWLDTDLNGDGQLDLVVAESTRDKIGLLLSDPVAGFVFAGHLPVGAAPGQLAMIDGAVAVTDSGDGQVSVVGLDELATAASGSGNAELDGSGPVDLLRVNGDTGGDARTVTVARGADLTISLDYPSTNVSGSAPFAIWGQIGTPSAADLLHIAGIGDLAIAPCSVGAASFTLADNIGTGTCAPLVDSDPVEVGSSWSTTVRGGLQSPITVTFQGVVFGLDTSIETTNAVVLQVQ